MKRFLFVFTFFITAIGSCLSQSTELEFVFRPAITSLSGNEFLEKHIDPSINISTGLAYTVLWRNNSMIYMSLLFDKKGGVSEFDLELQDPNDPMTDGKITNRSNFSYVTLPVQWGKRFGEKVKFQFGVGGYAAMLLRHMSIVKGIYGPTMSSKTNDTKYYKQFDFGLSASASLCIPLGDNLMIKAGIDDFFGLSDVNDGYAGPIKHNSLGLSTGLVFRFD